MKHLLATKKGKDLNFRSDRFFCWGLILMMAFFFWSHVLTINYPYFTEDEATYRILGSLWHLHFLEAGFVWQMLIGMANRINEFNYRYLAVFELTVCSGAIFYALAKSGSLRIGLVAVILFLASPLSFYVFHSARPEALHAAMALCVVACFSKVFGMLDSRYEYKLSMVLFIIMIMMLINLLLPYTHMFGLVHMPATFFLIIVAICFLPVSAFMRIALCSIFATIEFINILSFVTHALPVAVSKSSFFERVQWAFSAIDKQPASFLYHDTAMLHGNRVPDFLSYRFAKGRYLQTATTFLLWFGFLGAVFTVAQGVVKKSWTTKTFIGVSILIFILTFFAAVIKAGYFNLAYMAALIPWLSMGCALGIDFLITPVRRVFFSYISALFALCFFMVIVLFGIGQLIIYSWPLRQTSFLNNVTAIKLALVSEHCEDVVYISAPYQGFVSMRPLESFMQYAPDFIVNYTANLRYIFGAPELHGVFGSLYDATLERLNKPNACIVASEHQLFSLGAFAGYTKLKVSDFFMDNFKVLKQIQAPFYYNDPFPALTIKKFQYDITMGEPLVHHGSVEHIYILKPKVVISKALINKYQNLHDAH